MMTKILPGYVWMKLVSKAVAVSASDPMAVLKESTSARDPNSGDRPPHLAMVSLGPHAGSPDVLFTRAFQQRNDADDWIKSPAGEKWCVDAEFYGLVEVSAGGGVTQ